MAENPPADRFGGRPHPLSGLAELLLWLARRKREKRRQEQVRRAEGKAASGHLPQSTSEMSPTSARPRPGGA